MQPDNEVHTDKEVELSTVPTIKWKRQCARRTLTWFDLTLQCFDRLVPRDKEASRRQRDESDERTEKSVTRKRSEKEKIMSNKEKFQNLLYFCREIKNRNIWKQ